jgi:outer membrane protein assembly factor BamB
VGAVQFLWASKFWFFVLLTPLLVSFCFASTDFTVHAAYSVDEWPMFRHDPAHTSYAGASAPATNLTVLWTFPKGLGGSPVVSNGYIYVDDQNNLFCLNASNGQEIWKQRGLGYSGSDSSPAIYKGYVYTSSRAYDSLTGKLVLDYSKYRGYGSPTVVEDVIFIGSYLNKNFFALNATTGVPIWTFTTGEGVTSSPAVTNGYVYFTSTDDNIYALDASNGTKIWNYRVNSYLEDSSPAVVNGRVYVGSDENLYCLDALYGVKIWNNSKTGCTAWSSPAVANGYVYIGSMDNNMYAINASTGEQIWNTTACGSSSPTVAGNIVYTGNSYKILALNASTGNIIWNHTFPRPEYYMASTPTIANGVLYAGNHHELYAFGTNTTTNTNTTIPPTGETFPMSWAAAVITSEIVVGVASVFYVKKWRNQPQTVQS